MRSEQKIISELKTCDKNSHDMLQWLSGNLDTKQPADIGLILGQLLAHISTLSKAITELHTRLENRHHYLSGQNAGALEAIGQALKVILDHLGSEDQSREEFLADLEMFKARLAEYVSYLDTGRALLLLEDQTLAEGLPPATVPEQEGFRDGFGHSFRRLSYLLFGDGGSGE